MRGIKLEGKKEATLVVWTIRRLDSPKRLRIPLALSREVFARPAVAPGDAVKMGGKIADAANDESVPIFSGVNGTVCAVKEFPHPLLGSAPAVEIETDPHDFKAVFTAAERKDWEPLSPEELNRIFVEQGLLDLSGSPQPVHVKLRRMADAPPPALVINACEAEPYLTAEYALMMSHPLEFLKGIELLRRAAKTPRAVIVMPENNLEVAETLKSKIFFMKWNHVEIHLTPRLYPAQAVLDKAAAEPLLLLDRLQEARVFSPSTAYAAYEAVVLRKPLFERVVTVAGECVIEPKNIWARIGMDLETVVKAGKGFLRPPGRVILGGPMSGTAVESLDYPLPVSVEAVIGLPGELIPAGEEQACIRCGDCVNVCPVGIHPALISMASEQGLFALGRDYGAKACVECGNCTYVCPSNRPVLEQVLQAARFDNHPAGVQKKKLRRRHE